MRPELLLPFLLLALAALACDGGVSYNTIYVAAVDADADQPGQVRIIVRELVGFVSSDYTADDDPTTASSSLRETDTFYESTDYGRTWTATDPFDVPAPSIDISEQGYSALFGGESWVFPRAGFREFFYTNSSGDTGDTIDYFVVGQGGYHNRVAGDTIYISMGTEGILVGPAPGSPSSRDWELRQNIPGLRALPLNFSDPLTVAGVVLAALLFPPLPFIHAYLLSRVWRYLMPAADAWRKALRLSLAFAALGAIGIILWIVPATFDIGFYPMAITVAIIVVVVSIMMTVRHARAAGLRSGGVWRAGIVSSLVALLVPMGVLSVWVLWWFIALLVGGYMTMWALANGHLRRNTIVTDPAKPIMHWWTDRLALEGMLLSAFPIFLGVLMYFFRSSIISRFGFQMQSVIEVVGIVLLLALTIILLRWHLGRRGRLLCTTTGVNQAYQSLGTVVTGIWLLFWWAFAATSSSALFIAQLSASGWFYDLMTR
jgi:hypothetical protein